ncbi:MAG: hypothetical protein ACRDF7_04030 [Candidatus Limnocylindrales bacterium]
MADFARDRRTRPEVVAQVRAASGRNIAVTDDKPVRTLVFVDRRRDVGTPPPGALVVVLDPAWTMEPTDPPELRPIRDLFGRVVERHDLFLESLERLDAWAAASGAADRFTSGGVTWWFHARGFLRLDVHETLLWRHVLEELAAEGPFERLVVPAGHASLAAAARAGPLVGKDGAPGATFAVTLSGRAATWRGTIARVLASVRRRTQNVISPLFIARAAELEARLRTFAAERGSILAVVRAPSFHVIASGASWQRDDPYVGPVARRLADAGRPVIRLGIGLDHRRRADWAAIKADPRLLPESFVRTRFPPTEADRREAKRLAAHIRSMPAAPLPVGLADLGPAVAAVARRQARWFERQSLTMRSAERWLADLGIAAAFTGWESARTSWLGATHRLGIPSVAVQHGVIYPHTPDYARPAHPALVKPEVTCVFGPYERDLLLREGAYEPAAVEVSGSPRADPDRASVVLTPDERTEVRARLGVAPGDRMLVVSTARHTVGDEVHSMTMVGRLLDGPLPRVHIVFKLHPEEEERDHYEELLAGLARAGGYRANRVSLVRDIDVYRLLRSADAHLGQYSTVLTDAVLTATPNMIAVGQAWSDPIGHVDAGVAVPVRSVDDVRAFMAEPRPATAADRAAFLEAHYRTGDATARIAAVIERVAVR